MGKKHISQTRGKKAHNQKPNICTPTLVCVIFNFCKAMCFILDSSKTKKKQKKTEPAMKMAFLKVHDLNRGIFRTLSDSPGWLFRKNCEQLKAVNYIHKTLHLRHLTGLWIQLSWKLLWKLLWCNFHAKLLQYLSGWLYLTTISYSQKYPIKNILYLHIMPKNHK